MTLKSIIKNIQNYADKKICWRFRDEITRGENLGFEVGYEEDLVLEEERTVFSDRKPVHGY